MVERCIASYFLIFFFLKFHFIFSLFSFLRKINAEEDSFLSIDCFEYPFSRSLSYQLRKIFFFLQFPKAVKWNRIFHVKSANKKWKTSFMNNLRKIFQFFPENRLFPQLMQRNWSEQREEKKNNLKLAHAYKQERKNEMKNVR